MQAFSRSDGEGRINSGQESLPPRFSGIAVRVAKSKMFVPAFLVRLRFFDNSAAVRVASQE